MVDRRPPHRRLTAGLLGEHLRSLGVAAHEATRTFPAHASSVEWHQRILGAVEDHDGQRPRGGALGLWQRGRHHADASKALRVRARERERQEAAVAVADDVDAAGIDLSLRDDLVDDGEDEADVVCAREALLGLERHLPKIVPAPIDALRIERDGAALLDLVIEARAPAHLRGRAKAPVQHHHERSAGRGALGHHQLIAALNPANGDPGRGLDRPRRLRVRSAAGSRKREHDHERSSSSDHGVGTCHSTLSSATHTVSPTVTPASICSFGRAGPRSSGSLESAQ